MQLHTEGHLEPQQAGNHPDNGCLGHHHGSPGTSSWVTRTHGRPSATDVYSSPHSFGLIPSLLLFPFGKDRSTISLHWSVTWPFGTSPNWFTWMNPIHRLHVGPSTGTWWNHSHSQCGNHLLFVSLGMPDKRHQGGGPEASPTRGPP